MALVEEWTAAERSLLLRHFTNVDRPVFALVDLSPVVAGALLARYSRSNKSLRRLFLDEFAPHVDAAGTGTRPDSDVGGSRAEEVYRNVFDEYGDDSVAQLGGAHLAIEQCSNVLTKVVEWGRLAAYLEQSTRYISYDDKPGGAYRYHVPAEIEGGPVAGPFRSTIDSIFDTYSALVPVLSAHYEERFPRVEGDPKWMWRRVITAKACDDLRGLLPAATTSNVGVFGTGQALEGLILRLQASPLAEARAVAVAATAELRMVIPSFLTRVDRPDRGVAWSAYLAGTEEAVAGVAARITAGIEPEPVPPVALVDFDPDGEAKVVAAALYPRSHLSYRQVERVVDAMATEDRLAVLRAYVGERGNRRHKPGRAFERTDYRFDILCDYGAFRDLQRHRMCTIEWQPLSPRHGFSRPGTIDDLGLADRWNEAMSASAELHDKLAAVAAPAAPYAVCMAHRVRFALQMNARQALHLVELRSSPQGHPAYRSVAHEIHRQIADVAGHRALAAAMTFVDQSEVDLERLDAERRVAARRAAQPAGS